MQYPKSSGKSSLEPHQLDLIKLADLAGISVKPQILSILIEMLGMNIHPTSLHSLLRDICSRRGTARTSRADAKSKPNSRKSTRSSEKRTDAKARPDLGFSNERTKYLTAMHKYVQRSWIYLFRYREKYIT